MCFGGRGPFGIGCGETLQGVVSEQPRSVDLPLQEPCGPEGSEAQSYGGSAGSDEMPDRFVGKGEIDPDPG
jgi:hypothetical protein